MIFLQTFKMLLFTIIITLSSTTVQSTGLKQFFKFMNPKPGALCPDFESVALFHNSTMISPPITDADAVMGSGLWKLRRCNPTASPVCRDSYYSDELCYALQLCDNCSITEVNRYGDEFQNASEIVLFSTDHFESRLATVNETGARFPFPKILRSFYFMGNHSWSLYESIDQSGPFTCLNPWEDTVAKGYGVRMQYAQVNLMVGSVRYRCQSDIGTTTTSTTSSDSTTPYFQTTSPGVGCGRGNMGYDGNSLLINVCFLFAICKILR